MKKLVSLLALLALLLPVLAGCQSATATQTPAPEKTQPVVTPPETTTAIARPTETTARITADEAIAIALKDAKLTKDQVRDLDVELDRDAGTLHYEVDFEKDDKDYDYEIDAATGKILKSEKERD